MSSIKIFGTKVEVCPCEDGYWRHDTVFIRSEKLISKKEIWSIIQYLYDEGYIQDRRTKYYITKELE
jgi:hypothetical protein